MPLFGLFGQRARCSLCDRKVWWMLSSSLSLLMLTLYRAPDHTFDANDFTCGTHMHIYRHICYQVFCIRGIQPNLVRILVSGMYLAIIWSFMLQMVVFGIYMQSVESVWPCSILDVWAVFKMWHNICSVIFVKDVYITPWHIGVASDFICGIYMCANPPYISIKYLAYMTYIPHLVGTFVSGPCLSVTYEVDITVGFVKYIYANCWMYMAMYTNGCVTYIWNVAAIFVQW